MNRRERAILFREKAAEDGAVVSTWAGVPLIIESMGRGSGQEMEIEDGMLAAVGA